MMSNKYKSNNNDKSNNKITDIDDHIRRNFDIHKVHINHISPFLYHFSGTGKQFHEREKHIKRERERKGEETKECKNALHVFQRRKAFCLNAGISMQMTRWIRCLSEKRAPTRTGTP